MSQILFITLSYAGPLTVNCIHGELEEGEILQWEEEPSNPTLLHFYTRRSPGMVLNENPGAFSKLASSNVEGGA